MLLKDMKCEEVQSTDQIGSVMLASIFKNTECFFRLLKFVVNAKHTNKTTVNPFTADPVKALHFVILV